MTKIPFESLPPDVQKKVAEGQVTPAKAMAREINKLSSKILSILVEAELDRKDMKKVLGHVAKLVDRL